MTSQQYYPPQSYAALPRPPAHYHPPPPPHRGGSGCGLLKCLCCCFYFSCCRWCMCILLILIFIMTGVLFGLYYMLQPHVPSYNIENLDVKGFDLKNGKLYTDIDISVKAENPNAGIGLEYLENEVTISYSDSQVLSKGNFPPFVQPGKNITIVNVDMVGDIDFGPDLQSELSEDQRQGRIPLLITVKVPVRVIFNDLIRLRRFVAIIKCALVIDQIKPNVKPKILMKLFTYQFLY